MNASFPPKVNSPNNKSPKSKKQKKIFNNSTSTDKILFTQRTPRKNKDEKDLSKLYIKSAKIDKNEYDLHS